MDKVLVFDFGAQYGQLIARRIRDLHVYSEIVPCDISADEVRALDPAAIILSGGPASVYAEDAPTIDGEVLELGIPVLGFCYGQQIMAKTLGGVVSHTDKGEYGPATLLRLDGVCGEETGQSPLIAPSHLFAGTPCEQTVWMSHRDAVSEVPDGFVVTSRTDVCPVASMECAERKLYATQFHPEVRHTPYGQDMLANFLFKIAGLEPTWEMDSIISDSIAAIREKVGDSRVILGLSGGVDSSVVAALCSKAIGKQLVCVFVNHGLLRKGEPEEVEEVFTKQFDVDFFHVHAEDRYAELLAGVTDPEKKRQIIGSQFWKEFFEVAQMLADDERPVQFLAQGTIYPDIIESGARKTGGKASTIKSHHNLIPFPDGVSFDLIEPLDHFFKDEVRALGTALGLPDHIVQRQPFPGPGLAIRIIGDVTPEKLAILKEADAIVREELDAYNAQLKAEACEANRIGGAHGTSEVRNVSDDYVANCASDERIVGGADVAYEEVPFDSVEIERSEAGGPTVARPVWQYFAVLPDIRSVGVMGDERTYQRPVILRAIESQDAMTADWAKLPYDVLGRISSRIVSEVDGINRVVYDITPKPPGTVEWE